MSERQQKKIKRISKLLRNAQADNRQLRKYNSYLISRNEEYRERLNDADKYIMKK